MLLGLSLVAGYWSSRPFELAAAWLLVGNVTVSLAGGTLNWLAGTGDAFAQRSPGFFAQAASSPLLIIGAALLVVGALV